MNSYIYLILDAEGAKARLRTSFQSAPGPEKNDQLLPLSVVRRTTTKTIGALKNVRIGDFVLHFQLRAKAAGSLPWQYHAQNGGQSTGSYGNRAMRLLRSFLDPWQ
jgi:hypothetical protein